MQLSSVAIAAGLASTAYAIASFQPAQGIQLAVSVPQSTSSSGSGNIYIQFIAPTTYRWAAFGIGSRMAGSTIFVIYTDGAGNVTLSPRNGVGNFQPEYSSNVEQQVNLIEGSGVSNGNMVANIRLTTSNSLLNTAGTATNWISAWLAGAEMATTDRSASISEHNAHAQFTLDLSGATQNGDSNPFISAASSVNGINSSGQGSDGNPGAAGTNGTANAASLSTIDKLTRAHGIIMSIVMVLLFPIGAMIVRLFGGLWLHAGFQLVTSCILVAGFGIGVYVADVDGYLYVNDGVTHTVLGTVVFVLFFIQPLGGLLHHIQYKKTHSRSVFSYAHIWLGRSIMILGIVNGGLGLQLSGVSNSYKIAYSVVAGVVGIIYTAIVVAAARKGGRLIGSNGNKESLMSASSVQQPATSEIKHGSS